MLGLTLKKHSDGPSSLAGGQDNGLLKRENSFEDDRTPSGVLSRLCWLGRAAPEPFASEKGGCSAGWHISFRWRQSSLLCKGKPRVCSTASWLIANPVTRLPLCPELASGVLSRLCWLGRAAPEPFASEKGGCSAGWHMYCHGIKESPRWRQSSLLCKGKPRVCSTASWLIANPD
jgi:hypothetical protein